MNTSTEVSTGPPELMPLGLSRHRPCKLAKLESETAATGETRLLETGEPAAWPAKETLKYYVRIKVYKHTQKNNGRKVFTYK